MAQSIIGMFNEVKNSINKTSESNIPAIKQQSNDDYELIDLESQRIETKKSNNVIDETKICVFFNSSTPLIVRIPFAAKNVRLIDLKRALSMLVDFDYSRYPDGTKNEQDWKFFFKTNDPEFGVVKEEICDDNSSLPMFNSRIVAWIITTHYKIDDCSKRNKCSNKQTFSDYLISESTKNSNPYDYDYDSYDHSYGYSNDYDENDNGSALTSTNYSSTLCDCADLIDKSRTRIVDPQFSKNIGHGRDRNTMNFQDKSSRNHQTACAKSENKESNCHDSHQNHGHRQANGRKNASIILTSTSESSSPSSSASSVSSIQSCKIVEFKMLKKKHKVEKSSLITIQLYLNKFNFLGLSVIGDNTDGGIFICDIMKDSVLAQDGRCEPGDQLVRVNDVDLFTMSNEAAVQQLKLAVTRRGPIKLVVKRDYRMRSCQNFTNPLRSPLLSSRSRSRRNCVNPAADGVVIEPLEQNFISTLDHATYPINTEAWVEHNLAHMPHLQLQNKLKLQNCHQVNIKNSQQNKQLNDNRRIDFHGQVEYQLRENQHKEKEIVQRENQPISLIATADDCEFYRDENRIKNNLITGKTCEWCKRKCVTLGPHGIRSIVRQMLEPGQNGIQTKYREWLKVPINNCFLGSDLIKWLQKLENTNCLFKNWRDMQQFSNELLNCGYINNAIMAKCKTFSQKYYYVFTDLALSLSPESSVQKRDCPSPLELLV